MSLPSLSVWQFILLIVILILLVMAASFEFIPAVEQARIAFPKDFNDSYDCYDVLDSHPWYGKINYWLWLWIFMVPFIISFIVATTVKWKKITLTFIAIGFCYAIMVLSIFLSWDIRNAPFFGDGIIHADGVMVSSKEDEFKFHCVNIADGASITFGILFGWIPASLYVAFCFMIRKIFQSIGRKLRNIDFTEW